MNYPPGTGNYILYQCKPVNGDPVIITIRGFIHLVTAQRCPACKITNHDHIGFIGSIQYQCYRRIVGIILIPSFTPAGNAAMVGAGVM